MRLKIEVPNPCSQNWKEMLPSQNGKLCENCAKEVIDFTKFSNDQLKAWFDKANGERICGNFNQFQLDAFNQEVIAKNTWYSISAKLLIASCLTLFVNAKVNANAKVQQYQSIVQNKHHSNDVLKDKGHGLIADSLITIKGVVKAEDDTSPLSGVYVGTKDGKKHTVTDEKGRFAIEVPSGKRADLVFKYIGFNHLSTQVEVKKHREIVILMKPDQTVLGEVVIRKR